MIHINRAAFNKSLTFSLLILATVLLLAGQAALYFSVQVFIMGFLLLYVLNTAVIKGATIFHPIPLVSIVSIWSFVIAPVASVGLGHYMIRPPKDIDWDLWLIYLSWLYTFGVLFFCLGIFIAGKKTQRAIGSSRVLRMKRLLLIAPVLLFVTAVAQVYTFYRFGGVWGYMETWSTDKSQFDGLGAFFMVAEAFPILLLLTFVLFVHKDWVKRNLWILIIVFFVFFLLKLAFGGLRGSRSNTIWGIFWFAGIVHLYYFKLKLRHYIFGIIFLLSFMTFYSVYKTFGVDAIGGNYSVEDTGRFNEGPESMLLGDFSRAGVNAFILHEYFWWDGYDLKLGATYGNSLLKLVPFFDSPWGYTTKDSAGAELFYGRDIDPRISDYHNSRIFGLYGEGLLNFGPFFAVLIFFPAGFVIARLDMWARSLDVNDTRLLIVPFVSNAALMIMLSDSDNIIFFLFKNGFLAALLLWSISAARSRYIPGYRG